MRHSDLESFYAWFRGKLVSPDSKGLDCRSPVEYLKTLFFIALVILLPQLLAREVHNVWDATKFRPHTLSGWITSAAGLTIEKKRKKNKTMGEVRMLQYPHWKQL
ncbi:hypothetical protein Y032_0127g1390 [Ancylostoma ceylanicum]|uniref:Uncharacterized protein n=1 Tax=Ancylostoma ceylanicum TaxID=53326 RepID=A0A016T7B4_9BILA|nr:hypothetical protein Y032_0127g1390 [Ancylostoma ceylanicum]